MSTQVNFVCWSVDTVTATIPTEAATPSDAVLLATHAPLQITRRGGKGGHEASELVSEHQLLEEFLTAEPNNGVLVATIIGKVGAGKSHLVRWAKANIAEQAGRHVIYLQKTETSLQDVVEALLVDQHVTCSANIAPKAQAAVQQKGLAERAAVGEFGEDQINAVYTVERQRTGVHIVGKLYGVLACSPRGVCVSSY